MAAKEAIFSNKLTPPVGPFSPAVRSGDYVFCSGQVGQDPKTGKLVAGGIEQETRQVFENVKAVLEAAGKTLADVVRVGVFVTDMGSFAAMNAIYAQYFAKPYPARTTIGVASLPLGACVEIEVIVKG